jgi:hypothetical protein
MLYNEAIQMSPIDVVFLHIKPLHILYLFGDSARFTFKYKDGIFVESNIAALFVVLLFVNLYARLLDPRCVNNELGNVITVFHFPDVVVETLEIRCEYLLMSLYEFAELLNI